MTDHRDTQAGIQHAGGSQDSAQQAAVEKKSYKTPKLTELGSLVTKTMGSSGFPGDDDFTGTAT